MTFNQYALEGVTYSNENGFVAAQFPGEKKPSITARSFLDAYEAVQARIKRQQVEAAWRSHNG